MAPPPPASSSMKRTDVGRNRVGALPVRTMSRVLVDAQARIGQRREELVLIGAREERVAIAPQQQRRTPHPAERFHIVERQQSGQQPGPEPRRQLEAFADELIEEAVRQRDVDRAGLERTGKRLGHRVGQRPKLVEHAHA